MLGDITRGVRDDLFRINSLTKMPYEFTDNVWVSVTFEMSFDVIAFEREVYTSLAFLSDVGGLSGMLMTICHFFMVLWNYQSFDNYMVSRLFRVKKPDDKIDKDKGYYGQSDYIKLSKFPYCGELFRRLCCINIDLCCKRDRQYHAMQIARQQMITEINIVEIIKT